MRRLVVLSFLLSFLLGIPIWWKTTEVYRAPLPHQTISEINQLKGIPLLINLRVNFWGKTKEAIDPARCLEDFSRFLERERTIQRNGAQIFLKFAVECEKRLISDPGFEELVSLGKFDELDSLLWKETKNAASGAYQIQVIASEGREEIYFGQYRQLLSFHHRDEPALSEGVLKPLAQALRRNFLNDLTAVLESLSIQTKKKNENNLDNLRTLHTKKGYQLTFSLLNADQRFAHVNWDLQPVIEDYFRPLQSKLRGVLEFEVESQVQHFASLTVLPQKKGSDAGYFYLRPEALTRFVNNGEWNLASAVSSFPPLHFIVYIPPGEVQPLFIESSQGQLFPTNAFLIPRWGGVAISNPENQTVPASVDLPKTMAIFIAQVRSLIGVKHLETYQSLKASPKITFATSPDGITLWELDSLIRKNTLQNLITTSETLGSLSNLIQKISNMVILDEIQTLVENSLMHFHQAWKSIELGDYEAALASSKEALSLAERAFFDPNMLALLYFPDEHKYAIYVPLFLPISLPLLMAVVAEIRGLVKKEPKVKVE